MRSPEQHAYLLAKAIDTQFWTDPELLRAGEEVLFRVFDLLDFVGESPGSWNAFYREMLQRANLIEDMPGELKSRSTLKKELHAIAILALQESSLAHDAIVRNIL